MAELPGRTFPWPQRRYQRVLLQTALVVATAWGALALLYGFHANAPVRAAVIAAWLALGTGTLVALHRRRAQRTVLVAFALGFAALLAGWLSLSPRQDRDWADDVARLLGSEIDGSQVTLHNVRDFQWRSESDYSARWETRHYDLSRLVSADLAMSYWMGPAIAHTLVSFGFEDGEQVVFSLEIRKERDESFSALGGFFRKFEQVVVAADERDILRTRTNARGEDVYLYRLDLQPEQLRELFLGYLDEARALEQAPSFYNTLTSNCTTIIFDLARQLSPTLPLDHRLLLTGYFDGYVHDQGGLIADEDLATLKARGRITARALAAPDDAGFSRAIREGVPGMDSTGAAR